LSEIDSFVGRIGAAPCDDEKALVSILNCCADNLKVLVRIEGRGFASGAYGNDPGDSCFDLTIDKGFKSHVIEGAIAKRGNEGGKGSGKHGSVLMRNLLIV
jgi:hypothetical protein